MDSMKLTQVQCDVLIALRPALVDAAEFKPGLEYRLEIGGRSGTGVRWRLVFPTIEDPRYVPPYAPSRGAESGFNRQIDMTCAYLQLNVEDLIRLFEAQGEKEL